MSRARNGDRAVDAAPRGRRRRVVPAVTLGLALAALPSMTARADPAGSCNGQATTIDGTSGVDNLVGTAGVDIVNLLGGDDTFDGLAGDDVICGGDGNDRIDGGDDDDIIFGEDGEDNLDGENGDDMLFGGPSTTGVFPQDRLFGGAGNDLLDGGPGRDTLNGEGDDDTLIGGDGDDLLIGEAGTNSYDGGADFDRALFSFGPVEVDLVAGTATHGTGMDQRTDTIVGGIEQFEGSIQADIMRGDAGPNILKGSSGNDLLLGGGGDDELFGDSGMDILDGEAGDDTLDGGRDNDTLIGGPGDDVLDGGLAESSFALDFDWDEVDYSASTGPIVADAFTGTATGDGNDTLRDVSAIRGSGAADDLKAIRVNGGPGNDTLEGDEVDYSDSPAGVFVDLLNGTATDGHGGTDTILAAFSARGSAFDDELIGPDNMGSLRSNFRTRLVGGPGNDTLRRSFGGPQTLADYSGLIPVGAVDLGLLADIPAVFHFAGPPSRVGDFAGAAGPVIVDLVAGTATGWGSDTLDGIHGIIGSPGDDTLTGNDGPNTIWGMGGDDTITGGAAVDPDIGLESFDGLAGGAGNDEISGGDGYDEIAGEDGDDTLHGDAGSDTINGGGGSDTIDGGAERDCASFVGSNLAVTVDLAAGTASGAGIDTLQGIEDVEGSAKADTLRGDAGPNLLSGLFGDDVLEGREGDDSLHGGYGDDTLDGGPGDDGLVGGENDDLLIGGPGDDGLSGGRVFLDPAFAGDDTVSYAGNPNGVNADLGTGIATGGSTDILRDIDNLIGSPYPDTLIGNTTVNRLEGGDGADVLDGKGGSDVEDGGDGIDECLRDEPGDTLIACETETAGPPSGTIIITKEVTGVDPQDFEFNGSGGIGQFFLDDDSNQTLPKTASFPNLASGAYTVTETVPAGWTATSITCDDANSVGSAGVATINLDASEIVTCTFNNAPGATPGPGVTPTPSPTPTLSATPTPTPSPTNIPGEVCFNCIDDDGDGQIDRVDPECPPRMDAGTGGLGDPKGRGKAVAKCAKTTAKAGAKHATQLLKHLEKCANAVFACLQQKPDKADCLAKATATCAKEMGKIKAKDEPKLAAAVGKGCGATTVDPPDLRAAAGIGYAAEDQTCAAFGVSRVDTAADIADCLAGHHACRAAQIFGMLVPRAFELLERGGRSPAVEFPCLPAGSDGGGFGLGDPKARGKAAAKCAKTLKKEGAKLIKGWLKTVQKCSDKIYGCIQTKVDVAACIAKARPACIKQGSKLFDPAKGLEAKLAAKVVKVCGAEKLAVSDLFDPTGLGFEAYATECTALGVTPFDSAAHVAACIARQHACRAEQLLEEAFPRLREIVDAGGLDLSP